MIYNFSSVRNHVFIYLVTKLQFRNLSFSPLPLVQVIPPKKIDGEASFSLRGGEISGLEALWGIATGLVPNVMNPGKRQMALRWGSRGYSGYKAGDLFFRIDHSELKSIFYTRNRGKYFFPNMV